MILFLQATHVIRPFVTLFVILSALAANGCGDFDVVDKSKEVVISKSEYDQLKAAAALAKQVGRYQIHREGIRVWRLDTATGSSCLQLTSDDDWKNADAASQSCATQDASEARERHRKYPSLFDIHGDPIPPAEK